MPTTQHLIFWILSALTILCALIVIFSKNPIHSLLALIATFFTISGHYVLLNAQFLAIVNLIVYAGAIMVLFLFVIMLMNLNAENEPQKKILIKFSGIIIGGIFLTLVVYLIKTKNITAQNNLMFDGEIGLIKNLGNELFKNFVLPFELTGLLFLTAIIATVLLAKKEDIKN